MSAPKLNLLLSYAYAKAGHAQNLLKLAPGSFRFMVDSGAFTAWSKGRTIRLQEYAAFLESVQQFKPWAQASLDVIGDPVGTRRNFEELRRQGFKVDPVFPFGESGKVLKQLSTDHGYVMCGLGGPTPLLKEGYIRWLTGVAGQRVCHLFGYTKAGVIARYKPASVDASTWISGQRYGSMKIYRGCGRSTLVLRRDHGGRLQTPEVERALRGVGVPEKVIYQLAKPAAWRGGIKQALNGRVEGSASLCSLLSHLAEANDVERTYGAKYFLVLGGPDDVNSLTRAQVLQAQSGVVDWSTEAEKEAT